MILILLGIVANSFNKLEELENKKRRSSRLKEEGQFTRVRTRSKTYATSDVMYYKTRFIRFIVQSAAFCSNMKEITEIIVIYLLIATGNACSSTSNQFERKVTERDEELPVQETLYLKARHDPRSITDAEWQLILDQATFYVTRQKGTERRWSSPHNEEKRSGTYKCTLCHQPLFSSNTVNYLDILVKLK